MLGTPPSGRRREHGKATGVSEEGPFLTLKSYPFPGRCAARPGLRENASGGNARGREQFSFPTQGSARQAKAGPAPQPCSLALSAALRPPGTR